MPQINENPHPLTKYRPALTYTQMEYIVSMCRCDDSQDVIASSILKILIPLMAKVEIGAINPAYKLSESHLIKQSQNLERQRYENDLMSPEEMIAYENKILGI